MLGAALGVGVGEPAHAKASGKYDAKVSLIEPLTITKLSDLDFGDLVVTTAGTVVLTPTTTPTCTATGGVVHTAECQPAVFGGVGQFNQRVRVRRPIGNAITITGPGEIGRAHV
jgi:hypothetical protein